MTQNNNKKPQLSYTVSVNPDFGSSLARRFWLGIHEIVDSMLAGLQCLKTWARLEDLII